MKQSLRRRAAVAIFVFDAGVDVGDVAHDRFCGGEPGPALVPGRLVLEQLHECVPTRSRTPGHRLR